MFYWKKKKKYKGQSNILLHDNWRLLFILHGSCSQQHSELCNMSIYNKNVLYSVMQPFLNQTSSSVTIFFLRIYFSFQFDRPKILVEWNSCFRAHSQTQKFMLSSSFPNSEIQAFQLIPKLIPIKHITHSLFIKWMK